MEEWKEIGLVGSAFKLFKAPHGNSMARKR
jgi:hypothetical protein